MTDLCIRAVWSSRDQANTHFQKTVAPFVRSMLTNGQRLQVEVRLYDDAKTDRQRGYYHGVILKQIAMQARPNGVAHALAVWKEYFRAEYLGFRTSTVKNPITGKKSRRRVRVSTEDLGVKGYSQLIERVTAFAVTELGVQFPCDFAQYEAMGVDLETGEILG
jgi:hypothetical protein